MKDLMLRRYIIEHFDPTGYEDSPAPLGERGNYETSQFPEIARFILDTMRIEKQYGMYRREYEMFEDWAQGLPSILDTCYYYNRSAVEDIASIYNRRKSSWGERAAEEQLSKAIYNELKKGEQEE